VPPGMMGMTGALVQEVIEKSPAADAGLAALDVITQVDDTPLDANHPLLDVLGRYKPGDQVKLTVWRAGDTRTLMVRLGKHPNDPARPYLGVKYLEVGSAGAQPGD
jgi:serine protease Do